MYPFFLCGAAISSDLFIRGSLLFFIGVEESPSSSMSSAGILFRTGERERLFSIVCFLKDISCFLKNENRIQGTQHAYRQTEGATHYVQFKPAVVTLVIAFFWCDFSRMATCFVAVGNKSVDCGLLLLRSSCVWQDCMQYL